MNKTNKTIKNAIIALNLSNRGSSGTIMNAALKGALPLGNTDVYKIIPEGDESQNTFCYANKETRLLSFVKELFYKFHSYKPIDGTYFNFYTKKVIRHISKIASCHKKTIIHIHNIHHSQLNIFKLLSYLARKKYEVVMTIHDAWFYTGGCYCYDHIGCTDWQRSCENCIQHCKHSKKLLKKKIKYLEKIKNLHLIAVSRWVKEQLLLSNLKNRSIEIIYGCTDINAPDEKSKYDFGIESVNKKILISVSDYWNDWKGIKHLQELSLMLPNDYRLVLVGGNVDLSKFRNTSHIHQINDRTELARIYSSADLYISASKTETLGLSTCEAQICGCPVVTFGCGGSKETVAHGISGYIISDQKISTMLSNIVKIIETKPFKKDDIYKNGQKFNTEVCSEKYSRLYSRLTNN